ncbi:MAG: CPBP family intramembrane metalloprotease [Candidatus Sabulitectum sp.]|nr:CPBP family intramembrane metalloprotease [Candidatus Sabulitectum sp.]
MMVDSAKKSRAWLESVLRSTGYNPADLFYYFVLISAPILLTIYRCCGEAQNFLVYLPALENSGQGEVYAYLLEYLFFFILMLAIPLLISTVYGKSDMLKSLFAFTGLRKNLLWSLLAILAVVLPSAYHASSIPSVFAEYPLPRTLLQNQQLLPAYFLGLFFLYYLPWEFFFRGFLLFSLKDKYGTIPAILIQTISSCLVHIGKPTPEIIGSIPFGIIFGIIAIRTKNIWIVVLLHAALGIFTDLFIIYQG